MRILSRPLFTAMCALLATCALYCFTPITHAANLFYDMPAGVTDISQDIFSLHQSMFIWCTIIAIIVFVAMFYSILKHRKSKGYQAAQFHESTVVEIIWTAIPFLILILMAIPATRVLIEMNDTKESELTIKITASQWKWHYEYLEYEDDNTLNLGFFSILSTPRTQYETPLSTAGLFPSGLASANAAEPKIEKNPNYLLEVDKPLVIPTGQKVRFLLTSDDVIHSWWMPDFGIKKDTIPGFINESWTLVPKGKEGTYRGKCTELCGKDHGFMPVVVEAIPQDDFKQWLADGQVAQAKAAEEAANSIDAILTMDESMALGESAYLAKCSACHQANGAGLPPTFPALAGADIAINSDRVGDHINIIRNGRNAMPAFKDTLSPKEFAAIVTYERNAWGNDTGDIVQPKAVTYDHE